MSKTKRFIRTTEEAEAAPLGTVVLSNETDYKSKARIVEQKHGPDDWYPATAWEGSSHNSQIRGEVLIWGSK